MTKTAQPTRDDNDFLSYEELAVVLKRAPSTVRADHSRRPHTLPPSFKVPGCRELRWRWGDVREWIEDISDQAKARARAKKVK